MTLLAPALLALGAAALVPLVLHLLQRQQGPRLVFPAVRYLRRAEREHATRIRLRQLLLLAVRIAAVLLVAGAAARPYLRGAGAEHSPTSVVLILDNSLSTGAVVEDRRVFDELRAAALATLEAASPQDRFWLIRAGSPWESAIRGSAREIADAVRATEPSGGAADLGHELRRAGSVLAGEPGERPREIHLLSDLQESGLAGVEPSGSGDPVRIYEARTRLQSNAAVTGAELAGGAAPLAGVPSTLVAELMRWGPGPGAAEPVTARLVLDGAVRGVAVAPSGSAVTLAFPARPPGPVAGHVELEADGLLADNRRYFVAEVSPPKAVAAGADAPFVSEALAALEEGDRIRMVPPRDAEVVIAPGAVGADAVRAGRGVVVLPPSSPLELGAANQRLAGAGIPWRYGAPVRGGARLDTAGARLPVLGGVRLALTYPLESGDRAADVRLRLATGEPWAVSGTTPEDGRYVLLGSPLTPAAGTLPTSAAMVPLLDRALTAWLDGGPPAASLEPGERVPVAGDTVVAPDGVYAVEPGGSFRARSPGIHRVRAGGRTVATWAVNPPGAESAPGRVSAAEVARRLGEVDARWAGPDDWTRIVFHQRLGRELTTPLIAAVLLLLVAEGVLAASGRPRRPGLARAAPEPT